MQTPGHGKAKRVQHHFSRVACCVVDAQRIGLARAYVGHALGARPLFGAVHGVVCLAFAGLQGKKVLLQQQLAASSLAPTSRIFPFRFCGQAHKAHIALVTGKAGQRIGRVLQQPSSVTPGKVHGIVPANVGGGAGRLCTGLGSIGAGVIHNGAPLQIADLILCHKVKEILPLRSQLAPRGGQVIERKGSRKGGVEAAVVVGPILMRCVVHTGAHGHIPQQPFGGHGHQFENHAQATGHGQNDVGI